MDTSETLKIVIITLLLMIVAYVRGWCDGNKR